MSGSRATLAQVAARAGVSVSTASLAFSGSGPVSAATRERVLAAAEQLRYAGPDPRGRSLRQGRSGIIAVVMEDRVLAAFRDPVRIAVLDGIAQETSAQGQGLLLLSDVGESADAIGTATMDAAILLAFSYRSDPTVELLRRRVVPLVALGGPDHGLLTISIDDEAASAAAAAHLAGLGHTDVAIVTLPLVNVDSPAARGPLTADAMRAASVTVSLTRLRGARSVFPAAAGWVSAASSVDEGMIAGQALLADPARRPTAVIAQSDLLAAGVIRAAHELGLSVPGELSVIGFDGIPLDRIIPQDLTTMVQPAAAEGRAAGRAVLDLLAGEHPRSTSFQCTFHPGATTARPA
ncbi:LacI family DNA-binding transcriptional regulator [Nakamurella multipartita]|uniref:Transcriptional regulator, LacI family n=1 Tax=Nakamurella multipartita (strain ATCC 700099 / DSM 44233 / CIP 104796 / JCM 9543 / NBRC 105858 / Y-104) TaxID=479431 RepID=C8XJJ8_NAKMY|nr:substrate-binding domain-containing protein [Nakamurella multipartita]ACV80559.1 transcriptional regulator, LacI family [Nakamurella multipartita DSM 44233]